MNQLFFLYATSSLTITVSLFLLILLLNELGFRVGRFVLVHSDSEVKTLTGAVQAAILGLLALLLGFTFSMSMQRHDNRSVALIEEVNAIGTALLRVQLLPDNLQDEGHDLFREYVDLRVAIGEIDITRREARTKYNELIGETQSKLWLLAMGATDADPRPVTTGNFVKSLNNLIDSQGKRNALLWMHVPAAVLLILYTVLLSSGAIIGYSSGLSGKRILLPTALISLIISLIVFVVIDLDRPKRGLIQIDQRIMVELQEDLQ